MYHYILGNRGIIFPLTLVVHVLLIVISPCNVLWMRMTNEPKSATMVTINLKVSMCRDIVANSNITKSYAFNPYDSCNTDSTPSFPSFLSPSPLPLAHKPLSLCLSPIPHLLPSISFPPPLFLYLPLPNCPVPVSLSLSHCLFPFLSLLPPPSLLSSLLSLDSTLLFLRPLSPRRQMVPSSVI